jgi:hypothetical protein
MFQRTGGRGKVLRVVCEWTNPNGETLRRLARETLAPLCLVVLTLAVLVFARTDPAALCALPAFVLPVLFFLCRYPGERMLAVWSEARRRPWRRPRSSAAPRPRRRPSVLARGGLLLARSLAVRPPPRIELAAS